MCGIAGYVSQKKLDGGKLLDSLSHRGPDNRNDYEEVINGQHLYLGHTRLKIIDLSERGNQPMTSADGRAVISYNGEIYNFQDLKKTHLADVQFKSDSDTEVVLELYAKYGIDFISLLNGDFAIAIFDKIAGRIFLIRDRVGIKPLYFYQETDHFVFGSEIKALLASGIKPELNNDVLQQYFVFKYVPQNETLFKGVSRVPPGHFLEFNIGNSSCHVRQYWDIGQHDTPSDITYNDAQTELYGLLEDATRIRLISDVPVGTFLSGGLDSSIIAYFLKDHPNISHYCAAKSAEDIAAEGTTSDYHFAERLSRKWNLKLNPVYIGSDQATTELIRTTLQYSDDLIADGSQIPSYLITREAVKTSTVILSGLGADELFLGYAGHMITFLAQHLQNLPAWVQNPVRIMLRRIQAGKGPFMAYKRYLYKLGKYLHYPPYKYGLFNIVGDFENAVSLLKEESGSSLDILNHYFQKESDPYRDIFRFELENFLVKNLHYTDRMSMANSMENRVPFLDHRIIEFASTLPVTFKIGRMGKPKRILKDCFKHKLPREIINRRKAGFGMPLRSIFSRSAAVDKLLDRNMLNDLNIFDMKNIEQIINRHLTGHEDNSSLIYALIAFQEWHKLYIN